SFFHDPDTTPLDTLSLHDALPIYVRPEVVEVDPEAQERARPAHVFSVRASRAASGSRPATASREAGISRCGGGHGEDVSRTRAQIGRHTSELQSRGHLVCRLLLEK